MMKKTMILAFVLASVVSSGAHATAVCAGDPAGVAVDVTAAGKYVKKTFSAKCSANVLSNYSENNTAFGVVAGSKKGKSLFAGGTEGGGVKRVAGTAGDCPATGCTTAEVSDSASTAAMGQSSGT
ncbi:MAG: hypothetical protein AW12_00764 [Candidatus Accumulibacter sp. BA-94]|uniref:hypothetical protein n=1 Tax=Accumulibacter sp. TaxID=2053492 RepID=UPI0004459D06|nr:hypothetical protein [Accumulibacter sp.]EXI92185.1 MAG: hypothetical protein AW12_00764 [Candidatus Accumulibacter sp. BA-94]